MKRAGNKHTAILIWKRKEKRENVIQLEELQTREMIFQQTRGAARTSSKREDLMEKKQHFRNENVSAKRIFQQTISV